MPDVNCNQFCVVQHVGKEGTTLYMPFEFVELHNSLTEALSSLNITQFDKIIISRESTWPK